jgi:hypothetical protein
MCDGVKPIESRSELIDQRRPERENPQLDEHPFSLFASPIAWRLPHKFVCPLALCDVLAGTHDPYRFLLIVKNNLPTLFYILDTGIGQQQAVLNRANGLPGERFVKGICNFGSIFRMDKIQKTLMRSVKGGGIGLKDAVGFFRPGDRQRGHIRFPTADFCDPLRCYQTTALDLQLIGQLPLRLLTCY